LRYTLFAARFVAGWLVSLVLLLGVALLANIEWARPQIEGQLSASFHRRVHLGRLAWTLGLNGISVNTDRFVMDDKDGGPCIKSGPSEIGIAFLPLFNGELLINHLKFQNPEIWATWQSPTNWTLTDLFVDGPEVKYLQLDRARMHLKRLPAATYQGQPLMLAAGFDIKLDNWQSYDLHDVDVKLISTKRKRQWPFYLAFRYQEPNSKEFTHVRFDVTGEGPFQDWQKNKYKCDLKVTHLNPLTLKSFVPAMATTSGDCDVHVTADGIFDVGLNTVVTATLKQLVVAGQGAGTQPVSMPPMQASARLTATPDHLRWDNSSCESGEVHIQSSGDIWDWQQANSRYRADVNARLKQVESFSTTSVARLLRNANLALAAIPQATQAGMVNASHNGTTTAADLLPAVALAPVNSSAMVALNVTGNNKQRHIVTRVKAERVPLRKMVGAGPDSPFGAMLNISPTADIRGDIEIGPDNRIALKKVEIPLTGSTIKASGFIDPATKQSVFSFQGDNLLLTEEHTRQLLQDDKSSSPLALSGRLDISGELSIKQRSRQIKLHSRLIDARISAPSDKPIATKLSGGFDYDGKSVVFNDIHGLLSPGTLDEPGGAISMRGRLGQVGPLDFTMTGTHVDMDNVLSLFKVLNLKYPRTLAEFRGQAKDFYLSVHGTAEQPIVNLSISPERMTYHGNALPPEVAKTFKFNSGNVRYQGNQLSMTDLSIVSPSGKYTVSCLVTTFSTRPHTEWIKIKTNGVDFHQVHTYLSSEYAPEDIRKPYNEFLTRNGLASVHGHIYGDLHLRLVSNEPELEGVFGFYNAGGTICGVPFKRAAGVVAASKNELLLQDINGVIGETSISVSGKMTDYQKRTARWMVEVRGQLQPQDIQSALAAMYKNQKIEVSASGPLTVRGHAAGAVDAFTAIFNCRADESTNLRIKTKMCTLHQPRKAPLVVDGSLTFNGQPQTGVVKLNNCHIISGQSILQGNGKYEWTDDKKPPSFDMILTTPNAIPASTLVAVIDPTIKTEHIKGTAKGTLALAGEPGHLLSHGDIQVNSLSIPELKFENIAGRIDSPRWSVFCPEGLKRSRNKSEATITLESGVYGGVKARDAHAKILFQDGPKPRLLVKDGVASISGGKVKFEGWYEPESTRCHAEMALDDLVVDQFFTDLMEHSGEISGLADARITLESQGPSADAYTENLSGHGKIHMHSGTVHKFGKLQEKLTQANFLHQGLFGFNLNNLLQSVVPVKTGRFKSIDGTFDIADGILNLERLHFNGNDMRLRAAGTWNIPLNTLSIEVAGNIPRVASSLIPGPVGSVSKSFTMQKAFGVLTFRKLQSLPSIPLLGDIASDNPRAFTFFAKGPMNSSNTIAHSIEKSFKWLPNKPHASAHPVPGI
jgi:hypothetical protein